MIPLLSYQAYSIILRVSRGIFSCACVKLSASIQDFLHLTLAFNTLFILSNNRVQPDHIALVWEETNYRLNISLRFPVRQIERNLLVELVELADYVQTVDNCYKIGLELLQVRPKFDADQLPPTALIALCSPGMAFQNVVVLRCQYHPHGDVWISFVSHIWTLL